MIENHFPAPAREFLNNAQNSERPTVSQKSPSPKKERSARLRSRVLAGLELGARKTPRVIYSDDSDDEVVEEKSAKSTKPTKQTKSSKSSKSKKSNKSTKSKKSTGKMNQKRRVLDSDSESDVELEEKKPIKTEKLRFRLRSRAEPAVGTDGSDNNESQASDDDDLSGEVTFYLNSLKRRFFRYPFLVQFL